MDITDSVRGRRDVVTAKFDSEMAIINRFEADDDVSLLHGADSEIDDSHASRDTRVIGKDSCQGI